MVVNGLTSGMPCAWEGLLRKSGMSVYFSLCVLALMEFAALLVNKRCRSTVFGLSFPSSCTRRQPLLSCYSALGEVFPRRLRRGKSSVFRAGKRTGQAELPRKCMVD